MNQLDNVDIAFNGTAQVVLKVAAAMIMFSIAIDVRPGDLRRAVRRPGVILVAVVAQFVLLPLLTVGLIKVLDLADSVALGLLLAACCPPGKISNFLTLRAGGDLALSVSMTTVSNFVSVATLPLTFPLWARLDSGTDRVLGSARVSTGAFLVEVLIVVALPLVLGILAAGRWPGAMARIRPLLQGAGVAVLLLLVVASVAANLAVFRDQLHAVFGAVLVQEVLAFALGYAVAAGVRVVAPGRRAVTFEVGVRNTGLGLVIVLAHFQHLGGMAVTVAWWSVWTILCGFLLAGFWARGDRRAAGLAAD